MKYKALETQLTADGPVTGLTEKDRSELPDHELLIQVEYSSLNYKDSLSAYGNKGVTRNYPHTPGIDAAGIILESNDSAYPVGSKVIAMGFDFGMNTHGALSELIRVPKEWVVLLSEDTDLRKMMVFGTAGLTAALSVNKLIEAGIRTTDGKVLVTGATGGVGIIATSILIKLGYTVEAVSGKKELRESLLDLGVSEVYPREEVLDMNQKALLKPRWKAVIDTVGGTMLADVVKQVAYDGVVTTCGNIGGDSFSSSVYPFILRAVSLLGVDCVQIDMNLRIKMWTKLNDEWFNSKLMRFVKEVDLKGAIDVLDAIYHKRHFGRTVVKIKD